MVRLLGLESVPAPPHAFVLRAEELLYGGFAAGPQGFAFDLHARVVLPEGLFAAGALGGPVRHPGAFEGHVAELMEQIPEAPKEASLVLPDDWLRLVFTEIAELPTRPDQRAEILRWKLKRLVPYRVEDLRLSAVEVAPLDDQEEPLRILLGFGGELLMHQLEDAFASHGVQVGAITNTTLAFLSCLERIVSPDVLGCLVSVGAEAYTIAFFLDGEPQLYRYKSFTDGGIDGASVERDLRLTSSFIDRSFADLPRRAFLAAAAEVEPPWLRWMEDELGVVPEPLRLDHLPLTRAGGDFDRLDVAALLGAAALEVP